MIRLLDDFSITADKRSFVLHRADEVCGYFATVAAAVHWMRREMQMDMVSSERLTLKQAADRIEAMDQRILRLLGAARLDKLTKEDLLPGAVDAPTEASPRGDVPEVDSVFQARVNTEGPASPGGDVTTEASPESDAPMKASPRDDAPSKGANHEGRTDADTGKTRTGNSRKGRSAAERGAGRRGEAGRNAAGRSASGRTAAGRIS